MAKEIERKFLVSSEDWRKYIHESRRITQAYLYTGPPLAVRVRIDSGRATLNLKKATLSTVRDEFEYEIPLHDAEMLIEHFRTGFTVEKIRHIVYWGGKEWEVDEFLNENAGLVVAEVELTDEHEELELPSWLGREVSGDGRYLNTSLSQHPYRFWKD